MKLLRSLGISLVAAAAVSAFGGIASAQEGNATSLDDVLRAARQERAAVAEESRRREAAFVQERNTQQQKLGQIRSQVQAATAESDRLDAAYEANNARIRELSDELKEAQGDTAELFGAARSAASDLAAQVENSVISAQYPGRARPLREMAQSDALPSVEQLETLWFTLMQEATEQGKVVTFNSTVTEADGESAQATVTRIGPFSAFENGKYLVVEGGKLRYLARQPAGPATDAARRVASYNGDGYVSGVIDPTLGQLLKLVVNQPTVVETIKQGRTVGYVILGILALGIAIGLYKLLTLWSTGGAVRSQMRKKTPSKGNPLGRIMMAYESNTNADVDTLALKLDDALLREVPRLENGLNLIKVLAAVAPLLGLLGTVIGMIRTFQAITLFGTGDPQTMASGISEALVTTVLGLVAAIPLLLIHAFAAGAARNVTQVLEEQSAGMIAEHAESR